MTQSQQSATDFAPDDAPTPTGTERPTYAFAIGGRTYTARCPKQTPYLDALEMFERVDKAADAAERLKAPEAAALPLQERIRLEAVRDSAPGTTEIKNVILEGWHDEQGLLHGGYLRWCLTAEDYLQITRLTRDPNSDVDIVDLFDLTVELIEVFGPWLEQQAAAAGWMLPDASKRVGRGRFGQAAAQAKTDDSAAEQTTSTPPAGKQAPAARKTTSRATPRTAAPKATPRTGARTRRS